MPLHLILRARQVRHARVTLFRRLLPFFRKGSFRFGGNFGIATLRGPPDAEAGENDMGLKDGGRGVEVMYSSLMSARCDVQKSLGEEQQGRTQMVEG